MNTGQTWHKIAESVTEIIFSANNLAEVSVNGKAICVGMHNGQLFACAAKCPHAGGTLAHGYINAVGDIVCPTHRYKFSLKNGRNVSGEGYYLKTYRIEERTDGVFICFEQTSLLNK